MAIPSTSADTCDVSESSAPTAYGERLTTLRTNEQALQREHLQLGYLRLAFGVAVVLLLLPPKSFALLALAGFALASRVHERVLRRLAETRRAIAFYDHAMARTNEQWQGLRPRQPRTDASGSLYASDLDLFGPSSLFELLCEAHTSLGEDTLAAWLLAPAPVEEINARQQAIADLRDRVALREAFAAAPGPALAVLDAEKLATWGEAQGPGIPQFWRFLAPLLVVLTFAATWRSLEVRSPLLITLMLVVNAVVSFPLQRACKALFQDLEQADRALRTVQALLQRFEAEPLSAPLLVALQETCGASGLPASRALARLASLSTWVEARGNYLLRILDVPLLYSVQVGLAAQTWRKRHGRHLRAWLHVVGQVEALLSLAAYSYEHPADVFPQVVPRAQVFDARSTGGPLFAARGFGHPLLPSHQCVRNDVALGGSVSLLLISGSNMSGKSTLLRSVGINAVLAYAGATVRARALQISLFTVAASIRVNDSLQGGQSRFFAEILRLRAITEAAQTRPPVLFLIDEVLAGTNSSDRLAGAQGLINELLRSGAVGLLSTHDLALTSIVSAEGSAVRNMHFADQVIEGQLRFDYTLRDGVVQHSNGLALMRLIGLDV